MLLRLLRGMLGVDGFRVRAHHVQSQNAHLTVTMEASVVVCNGRIARDMRRQSRAAPWRILSTPERVPQLTLVLRKSANAHAEGGQIMNETHTTQRPPCYMLWTHTYVHTGAGAGAGAGANVG